MNRKQCDFLFESWCLSDKNIAAFFCSLHCNAHPANIGAVHVVCAVSQCCQKPCWNNIIWSFASTCNRHCESIFKIFFSSMVTCSIQSFDVHSNAGSKYKLDNICVWSRINQQSWRPAAISSDWQPHIVVTYAINMKIPVRIPQAEHRTLMLVVGY